MPAVKQIPMQQNALSEAITQIKMTNEVSLKKKKQKEIVDIIEFADGEEFLDLPNSNFNLWISQRVILKCFYMGTRGNENLKLTKEEWECLRKTLLTKK